MKEDENYEEYQENEEEINTSTTACPYKKAVGFFQNMFGSKKENTEIPKIETEDKEKNISLSNEDNKPKCPFGYTSKKKVEDKPKCPFGFTSKKKEEDRPKCPFGFTSSKPKTKQPSSPSTDDGEKNKDKDDDISSDDEPQGGCPVMNKGKKDPQNKHFEEFYEIPCFGPYDFIFFLRGNLDTEEWLKKSEKIRNYPRYMKYTLFYQAQEKLQKVHEAEFPRVFFIYDDIKQKANRFFRRKKFKECIEHLNYAYGLLKWIEFKDKKRQKEFVVKPSLDAVLDEDIIEKHVYLDDVNVEEDSFKACVVYLLEIMAYAHMELRQYHCAIECLDECAAIAEEKVPDVYFRRSQARTYNRDSTDEDLQKAKEDIEYAIKLKDTEEIYKEHKIKLEKIIKERNDEKLKKVKEIIAKVKRSKEHIDSRGLTYEDCIFSRNEDTERQYKILKEMKSKYNLAVKFFNETKNDEQLKLTYKEFEEFHKSYENFKFFYKFKSMSIDPKIINQLDEEEKKILSDNSLEKLFDEHRFSICDDLFGNGNYNIELFTYALEKIFGDERKEEEEREKREAALRPKVTWTQWLINISKSNFVKYVSVIFVILSIVAIGAQFYMYSGNTVGKI